MSPERARAWGYVAAGGLVWFAFHVLAGAYDGFALGLGSALEPTPRHMVFLGYFSLFGAVSVLCLTAGFRVLLPDLERAVDERRLVAVAAVLAFVIPLALRAFVLAGTPITDDEPLYRFMAELLASGRVSAPSHPMKLFFDHAFLVNDGRMFSQYFLGWPAFLSLGLLIGAPGVVNPLLSAATVPALYLLVKGLTGRFWAGVTVALFLTSPMLQLMAATWLSHTAAMAALTWTAYLALRAHRGGARWWVHAGLGLAFSAAFFVRPLTALGIGLPFLLLWARGSARDVRSVVAFAVPTVVLAGLFLAANAAQTGSALEPAYLAWQAYARENAFRFSGLTADTAPAVPNLALAGWGAALRTLSSGLFRLNFVLLGWVSSFALVAFAWGVSRGRVFWVSAVLFLLLHLPLKDPGIDTVGPVHFTELALPVLALSALGMQRLASWLDGRGPGRRWVVAAVAALVVTGAGLYTPRRLEAVSVVATLADVPRRGLEANGIHDAVVFVPVPYAIPCNPAIPVPSLPFVFWWPVNDPDFENDVLYANHLSVERDRELMAHFPGRRGWIQQWRRDCTLEFVPLDQADPAQIPNGRMINYASGRRVLYDERHPPTGELPPGFEP